MYKILVINPGSTSTKIAVYEDSKPVLLKTLRHSSEEMSRFEKVVDQFEFRKKVILDELKSAEISIYEINGVVGRGGMVRPIESGVYEVNEKMKEDLRVGVMGQHASNLGGLIADDIAKEIEGCRAFIADPVVVDELEDVARITGHPLMPRESKFHALNQKAVARKFAHSIERPYEELNLIVAHLGGGISVGAHRKGKIVDVNNALDGFGPLAPERAGTVPAGRLIEVCFSGKYTMDEVKSMITGGGGLVAHLGTNQAHVAAEWANNGNEKARLILYAMAYQIAKGIGGSLMVLKGEIDGVILTGGMAQNKLVVGFIREHINFLGKITIYPGEDEMESLATNVLEVLQGGRECKIY
ncbi:MAG TPA: butyrate kinase [Marinilabiliaceae bacterium]|nr:butyrate kinase [Marinilabiliaceae bacterium]